jgi:spermidine synthase
MYNDTSKFRQSIIRQILGTALIVFGLAASISVHTWIRIFSNIFGFSIVTNSQVLTVVLLGIAFGAYFWGKRVDSENNEISVFLFCNVTLGVYTIILLFVFPLIQPIIKLFFLQTNGNIFYVNFFKVLLIFSIIIYPSFLIGGILPTLSRYFIQLPGKIGNEISNLTALLICGVTIGSVLCSFILYPIIGVKQSLVISALLFLFIVFGLKILFSNIETRILNENEFIEKHLELFSYEMEKESRLFRKLVTIALFFMGFFLSSFMALWTRCGYYILNTNIYPSKVFLITAFLGFSVGSIIYAYFFRKHKKIYFDFSMALITLGAYSILLIVCLPLILVFNQTLRLLFHSLSYWNLQLLIYFLTSILIVFFPCLLIGFEFVLANRITLIDVQKRGRILGFNIFLFFLGFLSGLLLIGLFLLPTIGIQKSFFLLALTIFIPGLVIMFAYSFRYGKIKKPSFAFIGVVLFVILSLFIPSNHIHKIYHKENDAANLIYVKEGLYTTITINNDIKTNYLSLLSNGVTIGKKPEEHLLGKQILSHFPLFLHPKPDSILLIGFGEGNVARRILQHPVTILDCVEKSSEIIYASSVFNNNKKPLSNFHNFHLRSMNENSYLKLAEQKYNIIVKNYFHPATIGNNNYFSKEFFQSCKNLLTSPGILAVPVPMYGLSIEDFKILLRTFYQVFPSSSVWYNNNSPTQHIVLFGRKDLLNEIDINQLHSRLSDTPIKKDLSSIGVDTIYEALDCFMMGPSELHKLTLGVRINTENNPSLEFSAPKSPSDPQKVYQILQLLKSYREPIYPYISNVNTSVANRNEFMEYLNIYFTSSDKILDAIGAQLIGEKDRALSLYRQAYLLNRQERAAKIFLDDYYNSYLYLSPKSPREYIENANIYFQKTEYEKAISLLEEAIYLDKNYSPAYFALGLNYETVGDFETARQMYQKTLKLNPDLKNVQNRLTHIEELIEKERNDYFP